MAESKGAAAPAPLGRVSGDELREARIQVHWALQIIGAAGDAMVERRADDSQANVEWSAALEAFVGHPATAPPHPRAGLRPGDLTLEVIDPSREKALEAMALSGRSLGDGLEWMAAALARRLDGTLDRQLVLRDYDMPAHPVAIEPQGEGRPFAGASAEALGEVARWYDTGDRISRQLVEGRANATPVRCWPHHFDLAGLLVLEPDEDPEEAASIGIGMLLGDDDYSEPYWYVSRSPRPAQRPVGELAGGGHWHEEGFFAAVLTASNIVRLSSARAQEDLIQRFLRSALRALEVE